MEIKEVDQTMAEEIAKLAVCLTNEIIERTDTVHFDVDIPLATKLCKQFLESGKYKVIAAFEKNEVIGFGSLCESHSLYAEGSFGVLQEFYVKPEFRSKGVGERLIEKIIEFGKSQQWKRLELCTPPVPEFDRTVKFYESNGFEITGGYKMKRLVT